MIKVTVWNEFRHEKTDEEVQKLYPKGIHGTIAEILGTESEFVVRTATLDEPEQGLPDKLLNDTDVLMWWGHMAHGEVDDALVERIAIRVRGGMGMIVLHSGHFSKIFKKLTGASGSLKWREGDSCRVWVVNPSHPIAQGIGECIDLPKEEMYGEPFGIPEPDELVFVSWFGGGEVFRSGCCFKIERGKLFYFQPGHETNTAFHNEKVKIVLRNACKWAAPAGDIIDSSGCEWRKVPTGEVK